MLDVDKVFHGELDADSHVHVGVDVEIDINVRVDLDDADFAERLSKIRSSLQHGHGFLDLNVSVARTKK